MQVYFNRIPIGKLDKFIWHMDGHYCLRLCGVNIRGDHDIEPVYKPLVNTFRHPGQFVIEFLGIKKVLTLSFTRRAPYLRWAIAEQLTIFDIDMEEYQ